MLLYRYQFRPEVPRSDVVASLFLAAIAVEGIHEGEQARRDIEKAIAGPHVIDAGTPVGRDLAKVFTAFLRREFGAGSFRVERIETLITEVAV